MVPASAGETGRNGMESSPTDKLPFGIGAAWAIGAEEGHTGPAFPHEKHTRGCDQSSPPDLDGWRDHIPVVLEQAGRGGIAIHRSFSRRTRRNPQVHAPRRDTGTSILPRKTLTAPYRPRFCQLIHNQPFLIGSVRTQQSTRDHACISILPIRISQVLSI